MFEHVLVGIDLSAGGESVLQSLPALSSLGTRRVTLLHVVDVVYPLPGIPDDMEAQREHLARLGEQARSYGYEVRTELLTGRAAEIIRREAVERDVSLIVVGSRSRSRARDAFVGSTAWAVVHRTPLPVLVQKLEPAPAAAASFQAASFERILFPTDWSDTAGRALHRLEVLAESGAIRSFLLLHVRDEVEEARTGRSTLQTDLRRLEEIARRLRAAGAEEVETESPSGSPWMEIVDRARVRGGTLILMGTHGQGLLADTLLGGVSREVVRNSSGPVLLIPPRH